MIVTLGSVRGAPGVTSWALMLAAAWPLEYATERVLLEADAAGGVLGARYDLGVDPGVVGLVTAAARGDGRVEVDRFGRSVSDGLVIVPGPQTGEQARSVWSQTAGQVADRFADDDRVWLVDAGRLDVASPVLPLAARSALVVILSGAEQEDLVQVPSRIAALQQHCDSVVAMVVGSSAYSTEQLTEFFGTRVLTVRQSPRLRELAGAVLVAGRARRSSEWRSAVEVAHELAGLAHQSIFKPKRGVAQ